MRKFMMVATAAAIALVGLSANMCGGEEQKAAPETPPAESAPPAETPPAPPAQ
ncbi:MAG: hypothetical protein MUO41_11150 [Methyloceanibacter sp.]|nr:hypothetical protein [Methyloceanibacter sp.]